MAAETPVEFAKSPEVEWFTLPGLIIDEKVLTSSDDDTNPVELVDIIRELGIEVSFMKHDVISVQGNESFTCVLTNRIKPIWHFVAMDVKKFREEFFK